MTEQQAIDWCEHFRDNIIMTGVQSEKYTLALKAMRTAIAALNKQIAQKPVEVKRTGAVIRTAKCPLCDSTFPDIGGVNEAYDECEQPQHCRVCGQAIDWEGLL